MINKDYGFLHRLLFIVANLSHMMKIIISDLPANVGVIPEFIMKFLLLFFAFVLLFWGIYWGDRKHEEKVRIKKTEILVGGILLLLVSVSLDIYTAIRCLEYGWLGIALLTVYLFTLYLFVYRDKFAIPTQKRMR